jgi:hypothetical protein
MTQPNGTGDLRALRDEIRRTRAELGETVQALAAKADVAARIRDSAVQTRERVRRRTSRTVAMAYGRASGVGHQARGRVSWAVLATGLVALVAVVVAARGRRR